MLNIRLKYNLTNLYPSLQEGKGDQYPEKLKAITGKNLALTISLNEKNLEHGNTVYFASNVVEGVQTSETSTHEQKSEINSNSVHSVVVSVQLSIKTFSCEICIPTPFTLIIIVFLIFFKQVCDSANNENAIDDIPKLKQETNKRIRMNDNGANRKKKSKIV